MKKKNRYFYTGLFVLSGFLLFALGCVLFGGSELFTEKLYFETYFDSSVQGLDVGGAVKFRGVPIGKVESMNFAINTYQDDPIVAAATSSREVAQALMCVRVVCSINLSNYPSLSKEALTEMVQRGARTSLGMQGITGIVFVNLDYYNDEAEQKPFKLFWTPKEIYVPSHPTVLQNLVDVVQKVGEELRKVDFSKTVDSINRLSESVNEAIVGADLPKLSATFTQLGDSLTKQALTLEKAVNSLEAESFGSNIKVLSDNLVATTDVIREAMPRLTQRTDDTLASVREALAELKNTLVTVNASLSEMRRSMDFEAMGDETSETLSALSRTAASLEAFVDELREKPSRLIFDGPVE